MHTHTVHAKLTADDVRSYASATGVAVVTIPDAIAQRLIPAVADASGRVITDDWARCATTTLIGLACATPIPADLTGHWHRLAVLDRDGILGGRRVHALISGASAYNPETGMWLEPRPAYAHLRTWAIPELTGPDRDVIWREWDH